MKDSSIIERKCFLPLITLIIAALVPFNIANAMSPPPGSVLVEAERFDDYGAWLDDSQFMDQMGSPFLLAHGLGQPVANATTKVTFPTTGKYNVWVRTRDWVATWNAPGKPGRFQVLINDTPLNMIFGTENANWHWQNGGSVTIDKLTTTVALHDLTGFAGRCDALLFVPSDMSKTYIPPDSGKSLESLRARLNPNAAKIIDAGQYDLVVVGGGIAGTCASVSAARCGLSVALIQDRPVLGGNNSSEVRVWLQGVRNRVPYPRIGDIVMELEQQQHKHYGPENTADIYEDQKKLDVVRSEKDISLRLMHRANAVEMDGSKITAVIAENTRTGQKYRFRAKLFADCTGDGCLGALAGADFEISDQHMGRCNLWNIADTATPQPFPRCPWALDLTTEPFPGRGKDAVTTAVKRSNLSPDEAAEINCELCDPFPMQLGQWTWESGFNQHPIEKSEYIRDWNFRAAYGAFDALKNVDNVLPNHKLNWIAHISGKRESRRLLGDLILTEKDITSGRKFPDACAPACWPMDVHNPDPKYDTSFKGDAFISYAQYTHYQGSHASAYWIPYRCLYSRNITNMFMAGRDISVTRQALGATRVMRTGGCMGEVVGLAASICVEHTASPRDVWKHHLNQLKHKMTDPNYSRYPTLPLPEELKGKVGNNLAPQANITASSTALESYTPAFVNDRRYITGGNGMRWVSKKENTPWLEFEFAEPLTITAMQVFSGFSQGNVHPADKDYWIAGKLSAPIEGYQLQVDINDKWIPIAGASVTKNTRIQRPTLFTPSKGKKFRLLITNTPGNVARIWEVEIFSTPLMLQ